MYYVALAVVCLVFITLYGWLVYTEEDSPDIFEEGHEVKRWKDIAEESTWGWLQVSTAASSSSS